MFFNVFDPVLLEKSHVFLLKGFGSMMRNLMRDVFLDRPTIGYAHGEGAIPRLPREIFDADGFVNPTRGGLFDVLDEWGQGVGRSQTNQQMHMVSHPANGFGNALRRVNQTAEVFMETIPP